MSLNLYIGRVEDEWCVLAWASKLREAKPLLFYELCSFELIEYTQMIAREFSGEHQLEIPKNPGVVDHTFCNCCATIYPFDHPMNDNSICQSCDNCEPNSCKEKE